MGRSEVKTGPHAWKLYSQAKNSGINYFCRPWSLWDLRSAASPRQEHRGFFSSTGISRCVCACVRVRVWMHKSDYRQDHDTSNIYFSMLPSCYMSCLIFTHTGSWCLHPCWYQLEQTRSCCGNEQTQSQLRGLVTGLFLLVPQEMIAGGLSPHHWHSYPWPSEVALSGTFPVAIAEGKKALGQQCVIEI